MMKKNKGTKAFQELEAEYIDTVFGYIQCFKCDNFFEDKEGCAAFPDGIPNEIFDGDYDHSEPYPGDNGIQFQRTDVIVINEETEKKRRKGEAMLADWYDRIGYVDFETGEERAMPEKMPYDPTWKDDE